MSKILTAISVKEAQLINSKNIRNVICILFITTTPSYHPLYPIVTFK